MKEVLYISNVEVPYRNEFFNQLALKCNLTVLYEKSKSAERDEKWTKSIERKYNVEYLDGVHVGGDNYFNLKILKYVLHKYDAIIIGCYNSLVQSMAILFMRIIGKKYIVNLDGEIFLHEKSIKTTLKKFFLKGASHYLIAGDSAQKSLAQIIDNNKITSYPFSSLTQHDIDMNSELNNMKREGILVVGQYYDYKGLDIAVEVAKEMFDVEWTFVGTGRQTERFCEEQQTKKYKNVKVIPFLQKEELYEAYRKCRVLVLPSRQECWGLVVNEAASIGTPIVATWGSGAAVDYLSDSQYRCFLAKPDDTQDLKKKVEDCLKQKSDEYSDFLVRKSKMYTIEKCVEKYMSVIEE